MTQVREKWAQHFTRSSQRVANNLGIISTDDANNAKVKRFRRNELEVLDAYYESRQYAHLTPWVQPVDSPYIPVRQKKPLIQVPFARMLVSRITSKLIGSKTFPELKIEEDPDTEQYVNLIQKAGKLKSRMLEPIRRCLTTGSVLVRFSMINGQFKVEHYLSKYCYPKFDVIGALEEVRIQYVYDDFEDLNDKGKPIKKWFRMDLGKQRDILYDNPKYDPMVTPVFGVSKTADHALDFVQAEWFRTSENKHNPDGDSLVEEVLDFIDEMNYSMSQSSQALMYNQDPQLVINAMDEEEIEALVRSSMKAWNLGKEGQANFLEAGMQGVQASTEFRDKLRLNMQDIIRVVLLDPEKMAVHAQSGKAMEVLHGPMVELVHELRPMFEEKYINLVLKMAITNLKMSQSNIPTMITLPPGYAPKSFNISVQWPEIFPKTIEDLNTKLNAVIRATTNNIISRETGLKWIAKDFDVDNIEEEIQKINTQPQFNPFGGGFM